MRTLVREAKQCIDKICCIEWRHIFPLFAHPDIPERHLKFVRYSEQYATTAAAIHHCDPDAMSKTIYPDNLAPPLLTQVNPVPLVRYADTSTNGSGSFTLYRDKELHPF